jgi:Glyoxalase-like domain
MASMRGRAETDWVGVCLEAPDPQLLADFYSAVLGWPVARRDEHGAAIQLGEANAYLSFQEAAGYVPPTWPAEPGKQLMMMHVDGAARPGRAPVLPVPRHVARIPAAVRCIAASIGELRWACCP